MLRVLDLFSGIGAYALGVERAGMKVVAFCESEDFPRRVLRKHWPDVPIYEDVRTLDADTLRRDGIAVDVIVGGWPCQDISPAGTGLGLDGARSGLWVEVARLLGELRPQYAILENSANLLVGPAERPGEWARIVFGDLAALGRDAEWHCLPAAAFDAPHIRDRVWIVSTLADASRHAEPGQPPPAGAERQRAWARSEPSPLAYANGDGRRHRHRGDRSGQVVEPQSSGDAVAYANRYAPIGSAIARQERHTWEPEPDVGRVAPRDAFTVDRIHALGNCNPPIIPETIARAVIALHKERTA
ncbi:MAG: DNA cytosine methyltransferase [Hyphomonadaceae bacterium]|nr:DNA cytosine methyltransferase [Hyphomonadaceae bacterium]